MENNINTFQKEYKIYKSYEEYYNSQEDKTEAYEYLSSIRIKFKSRKIELSAEVKSKIRDLDKFLKIASETQTVHPEVAGSKELLYSSHRMDIMIKKLGYKLHQLSILSEVDILKKLYGKKITKFVEDTLGQDKDLSYLTKLHDIIDTGEQYLISKIHFKALKEIEDKIISENYPNKDISKSKFLENLIKEDMIESKEDKFIKSPIRESSDNKEKPGPGNPNFVKAKMPNGFYDRAEELVDKYYPDEWNQDGIATTLEKEFSEEDLPGIRTVKRRITAAGLW